MYEFITYKCITVEAKLITSTEQKKNVIIMDYDVPLSRHSSWRQIEESRLPLNISIEQYRLLNDVSLDISFTEREKKCLLLSKRDAKRRV